MKFLSDLISLKNFLMLVYMRGSKFFLGRRRGQQEDNVCQWRWGGGGRGFISYNLDYNVILQIL